MVMDETKAANKYKKAIDAVGIENYRDASDEDTVKGAAEILEEAGGERLTSANMKKRYKENY